MDAPVPQDPSVLDQGTGSAPITTQTTEATSASRAAASPPGPASSQRKSNALLDLLGEDETTAKVTPVPTAAPVLNQAQTPATVPAGRGTTAANTGASSSLFDLDWDGPSSSTGLAAAQQPSSSSNMTSGMRAKNEILSLFSAPPPPKVNSANDNVFSNLTSAPDIGLSSQLDTLSLGISPAPSISTSRAPPAPPTSDLFNTQDIWGSKEPLKKASSRTDDAFADIWGDFNGPGTSRAEHISAQEGSSVVSPTAVMLGLFSSKPSTNAKGKVLCDLSNAKELKYHCDDTVERQGSPGEAAPGFPLFKASHIVDNAMMAVNFIVSVLMIGSVLFAYRQKLDWKDARPLFMVTVPMLTPSLWKQAVSTGKKTQDGRPILKPPTYELLVQYTRTTQGRTLARREGRIPIGNFGAFLSLTKGEWFTEEGEFKEPIFRERLVEGLQKLLAGRACPCLQVHMFFDELYIDTSVYVPTW
ncbi:unnamed protein product [Malassezia sympodialis ATCC 42132]|uniref:uncharacterized protein n=1 Tax=Malassezia sympodialis (strain ATCC 42132) TaxID=1230383 RepID=UPI0002C1AD12|nr:uncharacterized protein MSY001_2588 [Malassezia sympodialis ATCC 42132]CCU99882.1 unnamed protein product [Malassezia sympodialis ATCC 42132]|eukprot:XP_018741108.1 uncharacterized protein MSY001_2588 [Malassezia sympodialis ATCC 42132]